MMDVEEPITPRACLYGGRTELFAVYKKLSKAEILRGDRIVHLDVVRIEHLTSRSCTKECSQNSLYPSVMSQMGFPAKPHPEAIDGSSLSDHGRGWDLERVRQYFGVFSVFLYFKDTPFYPPIPFKTRDKSVYGCCRTVKNIFYALLFLDDDLILLSAWNPISNIDAITSTRLKEASKLF